MQDACRACCKWVRWVEIRQREVTQRVEAPSDFRGESVCVESGVGEEEAVEEPMGAPDVKSSRRGGGVKRVRVLEWMVEMADWWRADEVNDARCGGGGASGEELSESWHGNESVCWRRRRSVSQMWRRKAAKRIEKQSGFGED